MPRNEMQDMLVKYQTGPYQLILPSLSKQHYARIGIFYDLTPLQSLTAIHLHPSVVNIHSCTCAFVMITLLLIKKSSESTTLLTQSNIKHLQQQNI